ncbi:TRAP transporter permease [Azospirillum sp. ST 5-10]|uniref:TRAP transporter permease n=1 Tax=unclassified Azospirillum TaxID=2630922 RepID=UPI003F4A2D5B
MARMLDLGARVLALALACFIFYTGMTGSLEAYMQRVIVLSFSLCLIFLLGADRAQGRVRLALSLLALAGSVVTVGYLYTHYGYIWEERIPYITDMAPAEIALGILFMAVVIEGTRRVAGAPLPVLVLVFLAYAFLGPWLPGMLRYGGVSLGTMLELQYFTTEGTFGIALGAAATFIAAYVIFGAFLERSGLGELLMDLSMVAAGRYRGGPAKVAVVVSGFLGTIHGSAVSNVATAGAMTIPLMKRVGYKPHFAAGVEAAASAGGQILPPVMGTTAFLMVQFTGIPYGQIALYALLPGILYYVGILAAVHWEAVRHGLQGLSPREMPADVKDKLRRRWHLLLPILLLIVLLYVGYSPGPAAAWSTLSIVAVSWLRKETRMGPRAMVEALVAAGKGIAVLALVTAAADMIASIFGVTGLGIRFADLMSTMSDNSLLLSLLLAMVTSLILGCGLPPSVAYVLQTVITIPPLVALLQGSGLGGDPVVAAHLFVVYFSAMAVLTPPDALASITAAGIARAPMVRTALTATYLAFGAFVIPFAFVYRPGLLLQGSVDEVATALVLSASAILFFSMGVGGAFLTRLRAWERAGLGVAAVLAMVPTNQIAFAGLAFGTALCLRQWLAQAQAQAQRQPAARHGEAG